MNSNIFYSNHQKDAIQFAEVNSSGDFIGTGNLRCEDLGVRYNPPSQLFLQGERLSKKLASIEFHDLGDCYGWMDSVSKELKKRPAQIKWNENTEVSLVFESLNLTFEEHETIYSKLDEVQSSYKTVNLSHKPRLFYRGKKTQKAYIFLHGLFMNEMQFFILADEVFQKGSNAIIDVLPGHEGLNFDLLNSYTAKDWLVHVRKTVNLARLLGDEVVVVGHSTGALLGFILALEKQVDSAILFQPALALTTRSKIASSPLAYLAKPFMKNEQGLTPVGGRMVQDLIQSHLKDLEQKQFVVPIQVFFGNQDRVVDSNQSLEILKKFENSPIDIKFFVGDHMYLPLSLRSKEGEN